MLIDTVVSQSYAISDPSAEYLKWKSCEKCRISPQDMNSITTIIKAKLKFIGEKRENEEKTKAVCFKMQKHKEIIDEDIINCVVGPDATIRAKHAFASCGCRPRASILTNITICMGDKVTMDSVSITVH